MTQALLTSPRIDVKLIAIEFANECVGLVSQTLSPQTKTSINNIATENSSAFTSNDGLLSCMMISIRLLI
jgi:hypothetical protein